MPILEKRLQGKTHDKNLPYSAKMRYLCDHSRGACLALSDIEKTQIKTQDKEGLRKCRKNSMKTLTE